MTQDLADDAKRNANLLDAVDANQALTLSLLRQHELIEAAELLNVKLQEEMDARKKAEEALVNSEKLASVGRMAAVLAHEINNPLEAVMNTLYLAQTAPDLPDSARQYLAIADGELRRIAHITRQTLGFYRDSTAPQSFSLSSLLDSICELLQAKMLSKHAAVKRQCDDHLNITAFQGELRQVLSNLLLNSLEAIQDNGRVTLRASHATGKSGKDFIRISIADDGEGISSTTLSKIFKPFFTTKGSVGNGLGLWVSKQIVEKHGGCIQVRSSKSEPRQGTTFSILIPKTIA